MYISSAFGRQFLAIEGRACAAWMRRWSVQGCINSDSAVNNQNTAQV